MAEITSTNPGALYRLLRTLAKIGFLPKNAASFASPPD
jgi:hypothetical protein